MESNMDKYLSLLTILLMLSCESATFDSKKEEKIVKQDLFVKVFDSLIKGDIESVMEAVPDSGDIFVGFGEIVRDTKDQIRKGYESELSQIKCESYELVEGPYIKFIDSNNCYGTAKIKWTCIKASDTVNTKNEFVISTLFVGHKERNGKWVRVASSQTERQK